MYTVGYIDEKNFACKFRKICTLLLCSTVVVLQSERAGFCPHWSEVVGPNHHSTFLTTTLATFTTTHIVNYCTKWLLFMKFDCHLAKSNHHSDNPGQNPERGLYYFSTYFHRINEISYNTKNVKTG